MNILNPPAVARPRIKRFNVREFEQIDDLGMLAHRVELVDGEIIEMPSPGNAHSICRARINSRLLPHWLPPKFLGSQETHRFPNGWCPMSDFALLDDFPVAGALVDPPVQLAIEISDSTLEYDLGPKRLRYAHVSVPEYVVVDVNARRLHVFRGPNPEAAKPNAA